MRHQLQNRWLWLTVGKAYAQNADFISRTGTHRNMRAPYSNQNPTPPSRSPAGDRAFTRRGIVLGLAASTLVAPFAFFSQQPGKIWRIGFLGGGEKPRSVALTYYGAFLNGMREQGYVEEKDFTIDWRFAEGKFDRLAPLAEELAKSNVDVMLVMNTPAVEAARKATTTVPVVMVAVGDPVGSGFVSSLARPGGNITGLSNIVADLSPKHVELLRAIKPDISYFNVLVNPDNSIHAILLKRIQTAAKSVGLEAFSVEAKTERQIESALDSMTRRRNGSLIVPADTFFLSQRHRIAELALIGRIPTMFFSREQVEAGGLMSYSQSIPEQFQRAATYVVKILKGAKPGDLPIEQPTKLEFVINQKTAKALGLALPQNFLLRADAVIE